MYSTGTVLYCIALTNKLRLSNLDLVRKPADAPCTLRPCSLLPVAAGMAEAEAAASR